MSFGGNAVSAAFCCAKLGIVPDLMTSLADDWLARMFLDMAAKYGISVHGRKVKESSLSFVMPNHGMRAIIRCRDDHYLHPVPPLDITGCRALHLDGHQADAAIHYAKALPRGRHSHLARRRRVALEHAGAARVHRCRDLLERLCEQLQLTPGRAVRLLQEQGLPRSAA